MWPRLDTRSALRDAGEGWACKDGPFGSALITLARASAHIDVDEFPTVRAPVGGTVAATLSLTLGAPASFGACRR